MKPFWKNSVRRSLDTQTTERILKEIFEACQKEANPTPLEILASYQSYRQERYALQKHILDVVLLLFFLLPLLFIMPAFSLSFDTTAEPGRPVYQVHVDTFLPISRVTAKIGEYNIAVYETGYHTYSIEPTRNGIMTVAVTLANHQYAEHDIQVDHVDRTAPTLISSRQSSGRLFLYLVDKDSGIYYEGIYAQNLNGDRIEPVAYDSKTGCIEFLSPTTTMQFFIPDHTGNLLQLVVSIASDNKKDVTSP